ncbi:hypothetical protein GOV10_01245, partial [Candidatus Woesearchaeota archaeon]|nr:hypothetical protein [Candidatus Woesearchaeota archaeon]
PYTAGKKEVFVQSIFVAVEQSGNCPMEPTVNDKTIIDIIEIQDVDPETGAVYPFAITNNEAYDKMYVFSIDGTEPWGYSQIEPRTLVLVPAGETHEGAVRIWANEGYDGEYSFLMTIQADDDIKQVALLADINIQPDEWTTTKILLWIFGVLVVLAIIVTAAIMLKERK